MTDKLTEVTKIVRKNFPHTTLQAEVIAETWINYFEENVDIGSIIRGYEHDSENLRNMVQEIVMYLRPEYNSPLYKVMEEEE